MASVSSDPFQENEEAKRKTVLEEKSKEDLIKIVKKQLNLLQKSKGKADELNKKCVAVKEETSSTIIQLQQQVETLEISVCNLTEENNKLKLKKSHEIQLLEEKVNCIEAEKNAYFTSLNEKEERLQCLSMQMNTMKETCQYFQDELSKLQEVNQELKAEIIILTEAKDAALKSQNQLYDSKSEEVDLKEKYSICIEENYSLTSFIQNLETEMKNLQIKNTELLSKIENSIPVSSQTSENNCWNSEDTDFSFLINDNQKLLSEINILKKENDALREKTDSIEGLGIKSVDNNAPNSDKLSQSKEFLEMKKENYELQCNLCEIESSYSKLRNAKEDLENEKLLLLEKLQQLEEQRIKTNLELDSALKEKSELKEEIIRLTSSLQDFSDFNSGYEHALLQGATTEGLASKELENKKNIVSVDVSQDLCSEKDKQLDNASSYFETSCPESICGFEFGLLGGGDVNYMFDNSGKEGLSNLDFENSPLRKFVEINETTMGSNTEPINIDIMIAQAAEPLRSSYEKLKMEKEALAIEIVEKKTRFEEYAALLEETLSENESLKMKIENYESEKQMSLDDSEISYKFTHSSTNTTIEIIEKTLHEEKITEVEMKLGALLTDLEKKNFNLNEIVSLLQTEKSESIEKCHSLSNEVESLKVEIHNFTKEIKNLELSKESIQQHSTVIEKQNFELSEKLKCKCVELDDINFQLELLVISIKQGVRQKTTATSNKTEKPLHENISLLKTLVDDLVILSNTNAIKIKDAESHLEDLLTQKQLLDEELFQLRELNQFLEDEARELRNEVEQLKMSQNSTEIFHRVKSPELYSIEEIDEKCIPVDSSDGGADLEYIPPTVVLESLNDDVASKITDNIEDISSIKNTFLQQSTDTLAISLENDVINENIIVSDYKSQIEKLNVENSNLKSSINIKSKLVDEIHCQMDSLLEKIEAADLELQNKDDDLKNSQSLVADLQRRILEIDYGNNSNQNVLKHIKDVLQELNAERDKLKYDILSLSEFSNQTLVTMAYSVTESVEETKGEYESLKNKNTHMEEIISYLGSYFDTIIKDLELWSNTFAEILKIIGNTGSYEALNNYIESIKKTISDLSPCCVLETECYDECCIVKDKMRQLNTSAQQLFIIMHNYLTDYPYHSVLKELDFYKSNIVPNLETTIKCLESRLCDNKMENKEISAALLEQTMEKDVEDSSCAYLKNQLAETEVKMNKVKQIALKLKKELAESKKQNNEILKEKDKFVGQLAEVQKELEKISSEQFLCDQNYQSLQNEYDKIQDQLEIGKENGKKLEDDLSATLHELNVLKEKCSYLESQLLKANKIIDATVLSKQEKEKTYIDLESKLIIVESKNQEKVQKIEELEASIRHKMENINTLTAENNNLKEQLDHSLKEGKKHNLLDLEMADYERSILELNNKILKRDEEINDLTAKLNSEQEKNQSLLEEIKFTETLKETEEKRAESLKEILEKTRSELMAVKETEAELLTNVSSLQIQLEVLTQQEENCKLQLSETSAEILHLKDMLKTSSDNHQRIVRSLETKISSQKQEIISAHKEVEHIKEEFENYKIRVHSVLKQQKSSTPTIVSVDEDLKEKLEALIDKLKMQVKDLSEKLKAVSMEYETLQDEHDTLLQRHNKAIEDMEKKDSEWHSRLEQINAEKSKLRTAQEEQSSQHMLQNEMLVATYKKQLKIMSDEHKRTVSDLQKQLESADMEIARLQRDQQKAHGLPLTPIVQENSMQFDILSQERQEGEGSESIDESDTPIRHLSLATIPTSGFLPFEKLLQSPVDTGTPTNFIRYQDCEKMLADLNTANKQIEHLSEVLNDSESTNLRLSEQVRVLKEEVRRLERNKEREEHAENLEYLKNVVIKFATLSAGSEKAMLIPVLTTMLKLSPEEQQRLKSVAGDVDPNDAANSGWGSYLHRWSGLA